MSTKIIEIDNQSFDLNSLFNISFSFEILKSAIEHIVYKQREHSDRFKIIEEKLKNLDSIEEVITSKISEIKTGKVIQNLIFNDKIAKDNTHVIDKLENKIEIIEQIDSEKNINEKQFNNIESTNKLVEDEIGLIKTIVADQVNKINYLDNTLEEIKIKIDDINLFESFNFKPNIEDNTDNKNQIFELLQRFDGKFSKKIEKLNEVNQIKDEEIFKLKNDNLKTKTQFERLDRLVKSLTEICEINKDKITNIEKINENQKSSLDEKLSNKFDEVQKMFDFKMHEINEMISKHNENKLSPPNSERSNFGHESSILDINRKINEIQKNIKLLFASLNNLDSINSEIGKIKNELSTKANNTVVHEIKENVIKRNGLMDVLSDQISQILEDKKALDEIVLIKKKLESLSSAISNVGFQESKKQVTHQIIPPQIDLSNYTENSQFIEFQKAIQKEFHSVKEFFDTHKSLIDELTESLKLKVSNKELKLVEEYLFSRIEEYKASSVKKFADKIDTNKNIKYLNSEIKHIIDMYIKKMEKGDSWLIAKKPLEGFTCGSCEAYIGDLNEKTSYLAWNKYPNKDHPEKYVGNGFSRMLQVLNIDNAVNKKAVVTSKDFFKNELENKNNFPKLENNLEYIPKNKLNKDRKLKGTSTPNFQEQTNLSLQQQNSSFDINNLTEAKNIVTDLHQPKIVKIYKKNRYSVDKTSENFFNRNQKI